MLIKRKRHFEAASKRELAAWLRQILAHNLAHALRDNLQDKRDLRRERSLEAEFECFFDTAQRPAGRQPDRG